MLTQNVYWLPYRLKSRGMTVWFPAEPTYFFFSKESRVALGPRVSHVQRPGREADHSPPLGTVVQNLYSCTYTPPPQALIARDYHNHGEKFTFFQGWNYLQVFKTKLFQETRNLGRSTSQYYHVGQPVGYQWRQGRYDWTSHIAGMKAEKYRF